VCSSYFCKRSQRTASRGKRGKMKGKRAESGKGGS
jgi:hypothetical protein